MQFTQFSTIATRQEIDTANAVIKGVSVIVKGEAQGHGLIIDGTTLEQIEEAAKKFSGGLKVRFNHPVKGKDASVLSTAGVLKNFRKDGDALRADMFLLKSEPDTNKILEMASLMPESFGLSVVFSGKDEEKDGKTFARCTEIYACDLVDDPAANPTGLFSTKNQQESMSDKFKILLSKLFGKDPEQATEAEIAEIDKQLSMKKCSKCGGAHGEKENCMSKKNDDDADDKKMSKAIEDALAPFAKELSAIKNDREAQVALAKKAEIDGLIAEASKDGKVLPLDTTDIYEQKDGKTTIKMEPSMLSKMIAKLPKNQVQLSRKEPFIPKNGDKVLEKGTPEWRDAVRLQRERGAAELTHKFSSIN